MINTIQCLFLHRLSFFWKWPVFSRQPRLRTDYSEKHTLLQSSCLGRKMIWQATKPAFPHGRSHISNGCRLRKASARSRMAVTRSSRERSSSSTRRFLGQANFLASRSDELGNCLLQGHAGRVTGTRWGRFTDAGC